MAAPFQTASNWTDILLEPMRQTGDSVADEVIANLFAAGDVASVNSVMKNLVDDEYPIPDSLPPVVRDYLQTTDAMPDWADPAKIAVGEELFWRYGPRMILILFCYSLPFCYVGRRGVQVLALTSRLSGNAARRVVETAQMLVDVLQKGGLNSPAGRGRRTLQKVRLMHAAVRRLAQQSPLWRHYDWGLPINQEDLAGTLMSFSWIALDGLQKIGIELTAEEMTGYLHCWQVVGHQLGIKDEMIPVDMASAQALSGAIARRQFAPCPEGKELTSALVKAVQYSLPGSLFDFAPALFIRYFLGRDEAAMLGISDEVGTGLLQLPLEFGGNLVSSLLHDSKALATLADKLGQLLINSIVYVQRNGNRPSFTIPTELKEQWGVNWVS